MNDIFSPQAVKERENFIIDHIGLPASVLMERAGLFLADEAEKHVKDKRNPILILAGPGNNGGDGLAAARILAERGYSIDIIQTNCNKHSNLFEYESKILTRLRDEFEYPVEYTDYVPVNSEVCLDCLYGTGLNRDLDEDTVALINRINNSSLTVISADIPSGLDADTGDLRPVAVSADVTLTFGGLKTGLFYGKAPDYTGTVRLCDVGIRMQDLKPSFYSLDEEDFKENGFFKSHTAHKGTYGKTLVVAGSESIFGAAFLCAKASFYSGAGLVKVYTHENNRHSFENMLPEAMFGFYDKSPDADFLVSETAKADTLVVGPGLSSGEAAKEIVKIIVRRCDLKGKILVFDADALNILAEDKSLFEDLVKAVKESGVSCVFTPHRAELMRLSGNAPDINAYAASFYENYGIVLVEKAAKTRIFGEERYINLSGNEGMATAGSGDVLSGILGGMLYRLKAGGEGNFAKNVAFSVFFHGYAGNLAKLDKDSVTMTATDMLNKIPKAWERLI
ncbi:MAG: NAD(P)H-hydrate dehydratase [Lachnospiraceae bacterium]|nr:NAD(P)H-hydrate dehydratase [Lachnospiraceae bacterium]